MIRQGFGCDLNVEAFDALFDAINGQVLVLGNHLVCEVGEVDCPSALIVNCEYFVHLSE